MKLLFVLLGLVVAFPALAQQSQQQDQQSATTTVQPPQAFWQCIKLGTDLQKISEQLNTCTNDDECVAVRTESTQTGCGIAVNANADHEDLIASLARVEEANCRKNQVCFPHDKVKCDAGKCVADITTEERREHARKAFEKIFGGAFPITPQPPAGNAQ